MSSTNEIKITELPAVWIIGGLAMFFLLARAAKGLRFYLRVVNAYFLLVTAATYGVLASVTLRLIGKKSIAQWATARAFAALGCPGLGIKFEVEGEEYMSTRPAVFISNHQSELDILMLGRMFPKHTSVTAKRSLKYMPFLGWFMALSGTVFIDRANRENALQAFSSAVKEMKENKQSVWIFPEGTRSYFIKPDMLPFKKGAFHLAIQAQVPIVPVIVQNYSHILHLQRRSFEPGTIKVKILPPIDTTGMTAADVNDLVIKTRNEMIKEIQAFTVDDKKME